MMAKYVVVVFFDDFYLRPLGVSRLACGMLIVPVVKCFWSVYFRLTLDVQLYLDFWFVSLFRLFLRSRFGHLNHKE